VKDTIVPGSFFEFEQTGVNLIAIPKGSKPPFKEQRQLETPFFFPLENWNKVTMGSGILVNTEWAGAPKPDGYIYVMGVGGQNNGLVIARVKPKEFRAVRQVGIRCRTGLDDGPAKDKTGHPFCVQRNEPQPYGRRAFYPGAPIFRDGKRSGRAGVEKPGGALSPLAESVAMPRVAGGF
jgi:hypothetical protein